MISRKEYIDNCGDKDIHRKYYKQFVHDGIKAIVLRAIGKEAILSSTNDAFNDIPLEKWDPLVSQLHIVNSKLKECGDYLTLGGGVCILKEAARQIKEEG